MHVYVYVCDVCGHSHMNACAWWCFVSCGLHYDDSAGIVMMMSTRNDMSEHLILVVSWNVTQSCEHTPLARCKKPSAWIQLYGPFLNHRKIRVCVSDAMDPREVSQDDEWRRVGGISSLLSCPACNQAMANPMIIAAGDLLSPGCSSMMILSCPTPGFAAIVQTSTHWSRYHLQHVRKYRQSSFLRSHAFPDSCLYVMIVLLGKVVILYGYVYVMIRLSIL